MAHIRVKYYPELACYSAASDAMNDDGTMEGKIIYASHAKIVEFLAGYSRPEDTYEWVSCDPISFTPLITEE